MDQVPAQFASSLATLKKVGECAVAFQIGSLIYAARNQLAVKGIEWGADYVMWFDSDMVFPADTLEKLVALAEKEKGSIITGIYFKRVAPYAPVCYKHLSLGDTCEIEDIDEIPEEPFEVEGCGFGCVLTPVEALAGCVEQFGDMFSPINGIGEDLSFCWRARQCGHKIIADPSIYLGHVGHHTIDRQFYEGYTQVMRE